MLVVCPHCSKQLSAPPELAGNAATCPDCANNFLVPLPVAAVAPEATTPTSAPNFAPTPKFRQGTAVSQTAFESTPYSGKVHVVTEKTGKKYKAMQAMAVLLLVLFLVLLVVSVPKGRDGQGGNSALSAISALGILGSIVYYFVARTLAWWHHG